MKQLIKLGNALLLCILFGTMLSMVFGGNALNFIGGSIVFSIALGAVGYLTKQVANTQGFALAGLQKEIWLSDYRKVDYDDNEFLKDGENLDSFIKNDKINFAEIGAKPDVKKNRTVYPIPVSQRTDTPGELTLDKFSSDSTLIQDAETDTLNTPKRKSVVAQHKNSIIEKIADDGMWNIAPAAATNSMPIIPTTGAVSATKNHRILAEADIATLAEQFDQMKVKGTRKIVVPPNIFWDFVNTSETLKAQAANNGKAGQGTGTWVSFYNFVIMSRVTTVDYTAGLTKKAFGSVPAATDRNAAIAYIEKRTFGKGLGSVKMYIKKEDPDYQGDTMNFKQNAIVKRFEDKYVAAIVPTHVP